MVVPAVDLKRGACTSRPATRTRDPAASTSDAFMAFDIKTGKLLWTRQVTAGDAFNVACGLPEALRVNCPEGKGPTMISDRRRSLSICRTAVAR
jgi:polyvinyl alcohol dehydrogenase (cytochrome)